MSMKKEKLFHSNVVNTENFDVIAHDTLKEIATALSKSLGYYGSNTILEDRIYGHTITKDGYTILNKIKFDDPVATTILEIIKNISIELVREVGDGSTSSIVIADTLYENLKADGIIGKYPMKIILETLETIEKNISEMIKEYATPITDDNFEVIREIATIANNNDRKVGSMIYDIYKEIGSDGFVFLDKSHNEKDYFEILDGIEIDRGYVSKIFVNQANKKECIFDEPCILLCNDVLDSSDLNKVVDTIGLILTQEMKPLVIIAKYFSQEFINCMEVNKRSIPDFPVALVDFAFVNSGSYDTFEDIACYTGATVYNKLENEMPDDFLKVLGKCDKIVINEFTTKILGRCGNEDNINSRIKYINDEIEEIKKEENKRNIETDIYKLENRRANLQSKIVRLFVGGTTDIEKETRKFLMEDSIFACRSALKYGYVSGGNLTIPKIISRYLDNLNHDDMEIDPITTSLYSIVFKSFTDCYRKVLSNSNLFLNDEEIINTVMSCIYEGKIYNLKTRKFETDNETTIINSSMTETMILRTSLSIIGLLSTSNQFISNNIISKEYNHLKAFNGQVTLTDI